jgi:hypothetical protein
VIAGGIALGDAPAMADPAILRCPRHGRGGRQLIVRNDDVRIVSAPAGRFRRQGEDLGDLDIALGLGQLEMPVIAGAFEQGNQRGALDQRIARGPGVKEVR